MKKETDHESKVQTENFGNPNKIVGYAGSPPTEKLKMVGELVKESMNRECIVGHEDAEEQAENPSEEETEGALEKALEHEDE